MLEAAEPVVTGVIFTALATAVVATVASRIAWLPELREVVAKNRPTFRRSPSHSCGGDRGLLREPHPACAAARFAYRGKEPSPVPAGSVWPDVFGEGREGRPIFVSAVHSSAWKRGGKSRSR